jgi:hypothetical protein
MTATAVAASPAAALASLRTYRGEMAATRTYHRRWWLWIPAPRAESFDGYLLLGQVAAKSYQFDEDTYAICEVKSVWPGARMFVVRKLGAEAGSDQEQYQTTFPAGGRPSICTCRAGLCKVEICRHRCGLAAVMAAGLLPKRQLGGDVS